MTVISPPLNECSCSLRRGFPDSSASKESTSNAGVPSLILRSGRSPGGGIGYPLQYPWASLGAQLVKNPPAMRETWAYTYMGSQRESDTTERNSLREKRRDHPSAFRTSILPLHVLHIVCISVQEVGHGVLDGFVLESRSRSKDSHAGDSGAQLSHSLALEVKYHRQVTQESRHPTASLAGRKAGFLSLGAIDLFWAGLVFIAGG